MEDILESCLADSTKTRYKSGLRQVVNWIEATMHLRPPPLRSLLNDDGTIDLVAFRYDHFAQFIVWTMCNTEVKVTTMACYRSAMRYYYKKQGVPLPGQYDSNIEEVFQGIRRLTASAAQINSLKDSGKRPLGFSVYEAMVTESLKAMDGGYQHAFLVFSWNLMARSKSTVSIQIEHISYEEDALGVTYYQTKTDQAGLKRRDPRHIYANPASPGICPFLALAIYLACHPGLGPGPLFPGARQRDRFGKGLASLADTCLGATARDVGTYSIRRGAATFVCFGSTRSPSVVSVCLRCGWSLVHFVGRVVAGLPLNQSAFSVLTPHFPNEHVAAAEVAVSLVFPSLNSVTSMSGVMRHCLASLVYHADYLVATLPPTHALLSTALFRSSTLLAVLISNIQTTSSALQPTGVPPYVEIYRQLDEARVALQGLPAAVVADVVAAVRDLLDERGKHTDDNLPYRAMQPTDLSSKKKRRTLSEWKLVMGKLHDHHVATTGGSELANRPSEQAVADAYSIAVGALDFLTEGTPQQRNHRVVQLKMVTVARLLREYIGAKTKRPYQKRKRVDSTHE
ncbi:hypothetical protein ACHHYP_16339 [Achlya hypogyna]|uniref:Core-binding (CB) domain-containing protein n=1 Tax=Achlya hypogyna TaxID=1202772 RepID=A0A1V9Y982_ACHHY|nr:hypothetical protein ACHHYP_16339 [Achlya hypogyna]